eukprot:g11217.t1
MGRRKKLLVLVGKYQISDRPALQESPGIEVKLGWDVSSNESVTVKAFDLAKFDDDDQDGVRELIRLEMNTLWRLDHPNVVRLVDVFTSPTRSKTFVVVEAVSGGGDLFEAIAAKGRLNDDSARYYFAQLLDAVEHCHARGVCHRNIKPENVLLDARGNVKLTGFALAGLFDPSLGDNHVENLLHATCGTPDYTAPEVVQGFAYEGAAADVWSLGVTLYAMLAGYLPFEADSLPAVFDKAQAGDFKAAPEMSVEARSLLDCMLEPDPESRYTIQDIRAHPWLADRAPKHRQEKEPQSNHRNQHHPHHPHHPVKEANLRWDERSQRLAGGAAPDALRRTTPGRDGASRGTRAGENGGGSDGGGGTGIQGWSLDSFVRLQLQQGRTQEGPELGPTDERREIDWCEGQGQQQNSMPGGSRTGSSYPAAVSMTPKGEHRESGNGSSSTTPSSFGRECDSSFHDCPSLGESEEATIERQRLAGEDEGKAGRAVLKGPAGLDDAHGSGAGSGSVAAVSAATGSCSSISSSSVAAAAAPRVPRSVCNVGSKATSTSGTMSLARRLSATRLVLSLRLLNSSVTGAAEFGRQKDPGGGGNDDDDDDDDDVDWLIPAKTLQRTLESVGCVCRLLLPTKKRSDEHKTRRLKVKACRAVVAREKSGSGGERWAEANEAESIVGVMFSVILPSEAPVPLGVASTLDRGSRIDDRSTNCGGTRSNPPRPGMTDFLAVLSTGTVVAFNELVDDLLAVPTLPHPHSSCLGDAVVCSVRTEERKERRQARSRRGRTLGISGSGGGVGGRKWVSGVGRRQTTGTAATAATLPLALDSELP